MPECAGGPFTRGQGGGVLARRASSRLSIQRQHSAGMGDSDGPLSQRPGGPFRLGQRGGVLARRAASRFSIRGQHSAGVGDSDGPLSQRAGGPFTRGQRGGVLARRAAGRLSIRGQHSAGMGDNDGPVSYRARRPAFTYLSHRIFARWPDPSHRQRGYPPTVRSYRYCIRPSSPRTAICYSKRRMGIASNAAVSMASSPVSQLCHDSV